MYIISLLLILSPINPYYDFSKLSCPPLHSTEKYDVGLTITKTGKIDQINIGMCNEKTCEFEPTFDPALIKHVGWVDDDNFAVALKNGHFVEMKIIKINASESRVISKIQPGTPNFVKRHDFDRKKCANTKGSIIRTVKD